MSKCSTVNHLRLALTTLTSLVDNSFECYICLDTYSDPYVIPECLHRFCGACVKESVRTCGPECPTCRARITSRRDLRKDTEMQSMVSCFLRNNCYSCFGPHIKCLTLFAYNPVLCFIFHARWQRCLQQLIT